MAKTKSKKTYRCGKCKQEGHNARACTNESTSEVVTLEVEEKEVPAPPPEPEPLPEHPRGDLVHKARTGATPSSPGCFECPACRKIGVLVLVTVAAGKDRKGNQVERDEMRCEYCHTQVAALAIAKWGAQPSDLPKRPR